jgi:AAA domain
MPLDLKRITNGRESRPPKAGIYGLAGCGKTPFVLGAPDACIIDADRGSHKYDVNQRLVPETWTDAKDMLQAVEANSIKCQTLILDSVTALEALAHKELFGGEAISSWSGGYKKGQDHALMHWREIVAQLERIWRSGKTILWVGHSTIVRFNDPKGGGSYDRYSLAMQPEVAGLISQWSDFLLFAREDVEMVSVSPKSKKKSAVSQGIKRLYSRWTPAYDAKARGILFPEEILMSWGDFEKALAEEETRVSAVGAEIEEMLTELADEKLTKTVREFLRDKPQGLLDARNRVAAIVKERQAQETTTQTTGT